MNKTLIYGLVLALVLWYISKFSWLIALGIGIVLLVMLVWKRRAVILTQFAAQAYTIKGDKEKGEKLFQKAYKTGEMPADCKLRYSAFCLRENKYEKARHLVNEVINSSRTTENEKMNAKHNLAVLLWKEGNLAEAIETMEEVHEKITSTNTYGTLGVLYLAKAKEDGDYSKVVDFMLEAYDYNDSDYTVADNLGETYLRIGEYEKAKEVYEKLLVMEYFTPMPYYNFGLVLKALGENERALENFEKALNGRFTAVLTVNKEMIQAEIDSLK